MLSAICSKAFDPHVYASKSVLAEGKWVKISVSQSGMHCIPAATLRQWGFSSPQNVSVHGYGGAMLPDVLSDDTYIDDLPAVPAVATSKGLTFYAVGPSQIAMDETGELTHTVNPYSSVGYYFLTEGSPAAPASAGLPLDSGVTAASTGRFMIVHEKELVSPGSSGRLMVGEDFNNTRTRQFSFQLGGKIGSQVTLTASFLANSAAQSQISFTVDGEQLPSTTSDRIEKTTGGSDYWGALTTTKKKFDVEDSQFTLGLTFTNNAVVKMANLDYLEVEYDRQFAGSMDYFTPERRVRHQGASERHVWDVTNPLAVLAITPGPDGAWENTQSKMPRHYAVWRETDAMPVPKKVETLPNQNLHGIVEVPDMVIITPELYASAANDLAELHRTYAPDPLTVAVVSLKQVLNEFGSGAFDPGALRRFLKMLYDRGDAQKLQYALMMGKGTCDNRAITGVGRAMRAPMPLWVSEASLNMSTSFSSDDYFAFLQDGSGVRPGRDLLCIAVGRIPATSVEEANVAVAKIKQYLYSMPRDGWVNRLSLLADDENEGVHMKQSERLLANLAKTPSGQKMVINKIYCDAYKRSNSTYPDAKQVLFSDFSDGMGLFVFIGHGSPTALGSKIIIGPTEFREKFHLRRLPFFYAATCSFLRWDTDLASQAESLMFQADGGLIGCISALRPVYITNNGELSAAFGAAMASVDPNGRIPTMGEVYRRAKNAVTNDNNKLRYVFMGDPALRLALPSNYVRLEAINGTPVNDADPITLMARQKITLTGSVANPDGSLMSDFSGTVIATLYDAEQSITSHGYGEGEEVTFEQKGELLFTAAGAVTDGRFTITVQMPANIADNYRPTTLSMYASGSNPADLRQAVGVNRSLYAYGYDEDAEGDLEPPVIHSLALNGDAFVDGNDVNPSPLLRATVSDNSGINLSTAGVGQKMSILIDGKTTFDDASRYFIPDPIPCSGAMSGTLNYPLNGLTAGEHSIRLRVWDMDGNLTDRTIHCNVVPDLPAEIYDVYTDASPARTQAGFYVTHNRPDQMMKVKITVYNLMGAPVWSGQTESISTMGTSAPVVWNLTDASGRRVPRGIYVYRAEITTDGVATSTASRKLAVAAE